MRWKADPHPEPLKWQRRSIQRFAATPTRTRDGVMVWLEYYWQEQHWYEGRWFDDKAALNRRPLPCLFGDTLDDPTRVPCSGCQHCKHGPEYQSS